MELFTLEVAYGSAKATFEEINAVLTKLCRVATQLGIDGASSIGWGLVSSVIRLPLRGHSIG